MPMCVCVCARARVRACVRVCIIGLMKRAWVGVCRLLKLSAFDGAQTTKFVMRFLAYGEPQGRITHTHLSRPPATPLPLERAHDKWLVCSPVSNSVCGADGGAARLERREIRAAKEPATEQKVRPTQCARACVNARARVHTHTRARHVTLCSVGARQQPVARSIRQRQDSTE